MFSKFRYFSIFFLVFHKNIQFFRNSKPFTDVPVVRSFYRIGLLFPLRIYFYIAHAFGLTSDIYRACDILEFLILSKMGKRNNL
jgi:hypothetical protein